MKLLSWNLLDQPRAIDPLLRAIEAESPDVVALQEMEWWTYEAIGADDAFVQRYPDASIVRAENHDVPGSICGVVWR